MYKPKPEKEIQEQSSHQNVFNRGVTYKGPKYSYVPQLVRPRNVQSHPPHHAGEVPHDVDYRHGSSVERRNGNLIAMPLLSELHAVEPCKQVEAKMEMEMGA